MLIGIIKNTMCTNVCVFDDLAIAKEFLSNGVLGDADTVVVLPESYGIGDSYKNGLWTRASETSS